MIASSQVISWFRDDALPGIIADPAIVVGGTSLLKEFLGITGEGHSGGDLTIAVPFIGQGIRSTAALWESMAHREVDLRMVVGGERSVEEARKYIARFRWKSVVLGWKARLHAKMYVFQNGDGSGAAMIGSHNMSYLGACANQEAGVLIVSRRPGAISVIISSVYERVLSLLDDATIAIDTTTWQGSISDSERMLP